MISAETREADAKELEEWVEHMRRYEGGITLDTIRERRIIIRVAHLSRGAAKVEEAHIIEREAYVAKCYDFSAANDQKHSQAVAALHNEIDAMLGEPK